jgi:hypothetical protein
MYRVRLEGSNDGQKFDFTNYDDAFQFASMAVEHGTFQDYHYTKDDETGETTKVWSSPKPIAVTIVGVEE